MAETESGQVMIRELIQDNLNGIIDAAKNTEARQEVVDRVCSIERLLCGCTCKTTKDRANWEKT